MNDHDEFVEIKERQRSSSNKIFNNLKPWHFIVMAVIGLIVYQITKNNENNTFIYAIVGSAVLLFLYSMTRKEEISKAIPRDIAQKIAQQDLQNEIRPGGCYPLGTDINPTGYFRDQSFDDGTGMKLFKYNIGFTVAKPGKPKAHIMYQMNPFTGHSKGIIDMPMGFDGQDIKDVQLVFPEATKTEQKTNI